MKVKTNLRAGAGQKRKSNGPESVETVSPPPVSRCVGI